MAYVFFVNDTATTEIYARMQARALRVEFPIDRDRWQALVDTARNFRVP
jgi:hypothetical protein